MESTSDEQLRRAVIGPKNIIPRLILTVIAVVAVGFLEAQNLTIIRDNHIASCRNLNKYKLEDLAKWEYILNLAPPPPDNSPKAVLRNDFQEYIQKSDAAQPCK